MEEEVERGVVRNGGVWLLIIILMVWELSTSPGDFVSRLVVAPAPLATPQPFLFIY